MRSETGDPVPPVAAGASGLRLPPTVVPWLLAIGTFAVGSNTLAVAGTLVPIATDLSVPVAVAGQFSTAFAVAYAISAPVLAILVGSGDRRIALACGASLFALGVVLQALAGSALVMLLAQMLAGVGGGLYVSNATATAGVLFPAERRGRALAAVYGGFTVATLAAAPLSVVAVDSVGWRGVLYAVAACAVAAVLGTLALPAVHLPRATLVQRTRVLGRRPVVSVLLVTALAQAAVLGSQVYLPALLGPSAGGWLALLLAASGVGIVLGNWAAGRLVDRFGPGPVRSASLIALVLSLGLGLPVFLGHLGWLFVVMPIFGVSAGMVLVPQQRRLIDVASDSPAVALGWGSSAIYLGAAVGAVAGGAVLGSAGPLWVGPVAAGMVVLALLATRLDTSNPGAEPTTGTRASTRRAT